MSLRELIRGTAPNRPATATVAIPATVEIADVQSVARIAGIAVAAAPETSRQPGTVAGIATVAVANPPSAGPRIGTAWDTADWRTYYDERAAIREYDGGMSRTEAERLAFDDTVAQWLCLHPAQSGPERCCWCTETGAREALVPYGVGAHAWLHPSCWTAWYAARKGEAAAALLATGVRPTADTGRIHDIDE